MINKQIISLNGSMCLIYKLKLNMTADKISYLIAEKQINRDLKLKSYKISYSHLN